MLEQITPLILTYNEAPNIGRTLERLRWARDIVVVDSFSDDNTLEIISQFSNVRVFQRVFDSFAGQWEFGLKETGIATEWVLALDADFILTDAVVEELESQLPAGNMAGYKIFLKYCVHGKPLCSSLLSWLTLMYHGDRVICSSERDTYSATVQ